MNFRWTHMPYCLMKLPSGNYLVVNRTYKPIGFASNAWVDYESTGATFRLKGLTQKLAAKISYDGKGWRRYSNYTSCLFLYNDSCLPTCNTPINRDMEGYLQRYALLAKLLVEPPVPQRSSSKSSTDNELPLETQGKPS
jgi:hypothetical protein